MLNTEEVRIDQFFSNAQMPYGMKITHVATGAYKEGNCKMEQSIPNMQTTLMAAITTCPEVIAWARDQRKGGMAQPDSSDAENAYLREQLLAMQARLNALESPRVKEVQTRAKAKKAAKGGWTTERRAEAAERMRAMQAKKYDEAELIAQQMRPPTDAPLQKPGVGRSVRGGTVAVASPEAQAKGFRP